VGLAKRPSHRPLGPHRAVALYSTGPNAHALFVPFGCDLDVAKHPSDPVTASRIAAIASVEITSHEHAMQDARTRLPTASAMRRPILACLAERGGVATNDEISSDVGRALGLDEEQLTAPHDQSRGRRSEFEYRLAWARTHLSKSGAIVRAGRKSWELTAAGQNTLTSWEAKGGTA
jgi:hypothetical protein